MMLEARAHAASAPFGNRRLHSCCLSAVIAAGKSCTSKGLGENKMALKTRLCLLSAVVLAACLPTGAFAQTSAEVDAALKSIGLQKGLCVVLAGSGDDVPGYVTQLASKSELTFYVQVPQPADVRRLSESLEKAGLLAGRVWVAKGSGTSIHLADNLADAVLVPAGFTVSDKELLRVLHPGGKAYVGVRTLVKPAREGAEDWSHPLHGPSNNPQSGDTIARAPYLTHYLATPLFGCQPEVTVASGGRLFRAFGHMAFTTYQNDVLQQLYATNAYNGTLLWKRALSPGFMIHRNTIVATPTALYLADDVSCKILDAATGELKGEIVPPKDVTEETVWKWMALSQGRLYALVGGEEVKASLRPGRSRAFSGWPWGNWQGYDYKAGERAWGFGRTFLAMDPEGRKVLWSRRDQELIDSRAVCMSGNRIYFYSPGKYLGCLDASDGRLVWKSSDPALLAAIGEDTRAQNPQTGFTTTPYLKCNDRFLFFAGPQRPRLVAASTADGKLLWQHEADGNFQLVLRPDALYAAGHGSLKFDYETGKVLGEFRERHNCTRATGSIDSIFFRAPAGTMRYIPDTGAEEQLAPMRPPCQDGVIVSEGLLHWGPWICGCQLSLFGDICLGPAGDFDFARQADEPRQLESYGPAAEVKPLATAPGDWPVFRADNRRSSVTPVALPPEPRLKWRFKSDTPTMLTAPVKAGELVFVAGTDGILRAIRADNGQLAWKAYTEGAIYFPPAIWNGRAYVGSNDGYVYAFEAMTGRLLWRFRVAPLERRIPFYGAIASTWPVAGGVVVEEGVVYAAAGINHFDGTHVCALDALTGKLRWHNPASGIIHPKLRNGISVQGNLSLVDGHLEFPGGNVYPKASFDATSGQCLNKPWGPWAATRDLFHPRQAWDLQNNLITKMQLGPAAGAVTLENLKLSFAPAEAAEKAGFQKWEATIPDTCRGMMCAADAVLVASAGARTTELTALGLTNGQPLWSQKLEAPPVVWGLALDGSGRLFVSLEDGSLICLAPEQLPRN